MLKTVLPGYKILYRDGGEPYLIPGDFQISVSHSFPLAALAISKNRVGIDLENGRRK
jgi:phosphopantetheinyl transferase